MTLKMDHDQDTKAKAAAPFAEIAAFDMEWGPFTYMCTLRLLLSLGELKTVIFCTALSRTVHDTQGLLM